MSQRCPSYRESTVVLTWSWSVLIRALLSKVCTFIFLLEMILKMIALKPRGYIKSPWNIFDGVVAVISLIDTVLTLSNLIDSTGTSVFRSFRLVSGA